MKINTKNVAAINIKKRIRTPGKVFKNYELYIFILPALVYFLLFHYYPMYGVQIAFKNFIATKGIWGSAWVGFDHFQRFFKSYYFWTLIRNTVGISLYSLAVGFPVPIILALMLNEVKDGYFKRTVQIVTYAPNFISTVVMVGMLIAFLSPNTGIVNQILKALGMKQINFMQESAWFKTVYVFSGVWQTAGWNSIIYLSALTGIDPQLREAAVVEGASRLKCIWHVNLPGILPTIITLLILNTGLIMSVGFEKVFLMQNPVNMEASDVISTYVYRTGLVQGEYSFAAAVGLFNSVVNFGLLVLVNTIAKRLSDISLW